MKVHLMLNYCMNNKLTMAALAFPQIFTTVGFAFPAKCCFAATTPFEIVDMGCFIVEEVVIMGDGDSIALLQRGEMRLVGEVERSVKVVLASKLGNAFAIPLSSKVCAFVTHNYCHNYKSHLQLRYNFLIPNHRNQSNQNKLHGFHYVYLPLLESQILRFL